MSDAMIPRHQWTHDGADVLLLKCVGADGQTYGGFAWPLTVGATVEAPDWDPGQVCGGGLHGWPWGMSIGDGKLPEWSATWIVFAAAPADVVDLGGKAKARKGRVVYVGDWQGATNHVLSGQMAWVQHAARGAASATGERGAAVVTGIDGRARSGPYGVIALAWHNRRRDRVEMRCARVGAGDGTDGHLKAGVWYRLDDLGQFVEVDV